MTDTKETDGDLLARLGTDGQKWAQEFLAKFPDPSKIDEGLMIGWFANAIEAGANRESLAATEQRDELEGLKSQLTTIAGKLSETGIAMPEDDGIQALDTLVTRFKELEAERDTAKNALDALTAKNDAAALKEAGKAKATPKPKGDGSIRALGPLKLKKDERPLQGEDLLKAIAAADLVEVAFSDGKHEIKSLPAHIVQGDAWYLAANGVRLRVDKLQVYGPNRGEKEIKLAGYALLLDDEQIAWTQRGDVLTLAPGSINELKDDVIF